jgi:glycosyltransferase involved in cell wall biosynthesis
MAKTKPRVLRRNETDILFILPVYNEERVLGTNTLRLYNFLKSQNLKAKWSIVIADNGSTDKTPEIGYRLSKNYDRVIYYRVHRKGRGYALKQVYKKFDSKIYFYTDIDLSIGLKHIKECIDGVLNGADIATGTKLSKESHVSRAFIRKLASRGYNLLARLITGTKISDLQCGFKAINKTIAKNVAPLVKDDKWFFDSELLILSERKGYKIKEIPITLVDPPDSKVDLIRTTLDYIKNLIRMRV